MVHISHDEVLKIARLSHIDIHEDEIEKVVSHLQAVLSYAARVSEIAQTESSVKLSTELSSAVTCNVNITKPDVVVKTDPEPILQQAPEREGNFFVVPAIIEVGQ